MSEGPKWLRNKDPVAFKAISCINPEYISLHENYDILASKPVMAKNFGGLAYGSWIEIRYASGKNLSDEVLRGRICPLPITFNDSCPKHEKRLTLYLSNTFNFPKDNEVVDKFEWRQAYSSISDALEIELEYINPKADNLQTPSGDEATLVKLYQRTIKTLGSQVGTKFHPYFAFNCFDSSYFLEESLGRMKI